MPPKTGYMYMMVRSEQRGGGVLLIDVGLKKLPGLVVRTVLNVLAWAQGACQRDGWTPHRPRRNKKDAIGVWGKNRLGIARSRPDLSYVPRQKPTTVSLPNRTR
jgi:hypothetical protein